MTLDLPAYTFVDGQTPLDAAHLNDRFFSIVRRLHALETVVIDWNAAVAQVQNYGLARINDSIKPLLDGMNEELQALLRQGETALAEQDAAVTAKLAAVDTALAAVESRMSQAESSLASALDGFESRLSQVETDIATALARAKRLAIVFG